MEKPYKLSELKDYAFQIEYEYFDEISKKILKSVTGLYFEKLGSRVPSERWIKKRIIEKWKRQNYYSDPDLITITEIKELGRVI